VVISSFWSHNTGNRGTATYSVNEMFYLFMYFSTNKSVVQQSWDAYAGRGGYFSSMVKIE